MSTQVAVLLVVALVGWFVAGLASATAVLVGALLFRGKWEQRRPAASPDVEFDLEGLFEEMTEGLPRITDELNEGLVDARAEAQAIGEPAEQMLARLEVLIAQERDLWGQNISDAYVAGMHIENEFWSDDEGESPFF